MFIETNRDAHLLQGNVIQGNVIQDIQDNDKRDCHLLQNNVDHLD